MGFADEQWKGNRGIRTERKVNRHGSEAFADFLRNRVVDEVVIALPMKSFYSEAARIVGQCQEQGVIVRVLNTIFDLEHGRTDSGELEITHVATYSTGLFEGWPLMFKRIFDILVSSVFLLLLTPLLVIVAILVRCDSPGPVFFVQERVGLNKRIFRMYKFRTMAANAEKAQAELEKLNEADGPVFKIKSDPRITRLGKFLRKTSIDELPQLLNVLKGDMSLVGPRPLPIRDYKGFEQDWLRRRFSVRPGITCLWQVNGRSSLSFHEWMKLDLHYIDNWSLWLDVKVIAQDDSGGVERCRGHMSTGINIAPSADTAASSAISAVPRNEANPLAPVERKLSLFRQLLSSETALHQGAFSLADQAVASATNFLTGVIIARACSKEELGLTCWASA